MKRGSIKKWGKERKINSEILAPKIDQRGNYSLKSDKAVELY